MSNTLTNLIPTLYLAADMVSRELTGLIPAVFRNSTEEQAAKDQTIRYPVVAAFSAADIAAAATGPDPSAVTVGSDTLSISKSRSVTFFWEGEEQKGLSGLYQTILQDQFSQAMRALANEVEADLAALYSKASRAYGTAGTTPFGTAGNFTDASEVRRILVDNGAPSNDLQLVVSTAAGAKFRGLQAQAQIAGTTDIQRQGVLVDIAGMAIRESAQIKTHTAGTGASATTDNAGYAVGDKTITLASAGTGTIVTGDVISHARDTGNKYVVGTGDADVSGGGTFIINNPGLRLAVTAATSALTLTAAYTANLAFARNAIHLITRVPAMPEGGDAADDVVTVTDPRSGLAFQVCVYRQRRRVAYEVGLAWGVKVVKPEFLAILLG